MVLFGFISLFNIVGYFLAESAPSSNELLELQVPVASSQIYTWRVCPGRSGNCRDMYRLCLKSSSLPEPEKPYCFISAFPIPSHLHNMPKDTHITLALASHMDQGRNMMRFWELTVDGVVELPRQRIIKEHNRDKNSKIILGMVLLFVAYLCYRLYRYGYRKSRMT